MIRFGGPDRAAIKLLHEWPNGLVFSPLIVGHQPLTLTDFLIELYFENGAALFGRESDYEMEMVRKAVGASFANLDGREIYRIVQYYVQRVRNYSHIEVFTHNGDRRAESTGECHPIRTFDIVDAASWVKWFKTLSHEEYVRRVYGKDYGFPPFDLDCRCRMDGIVPGADY